MTRAVVRLFVAFAFCAGVHPAGAWAEAQVTLDDFEDIDGWQVVVSDDVRASIRSAPGPHGRAMCLDFDFGSVSGYASVRRKLPIDYPDNFEFSFDLRGDSPGDALQFKLVDATGENVWWANRPDYSFASEWRRVSFRKRHIDFAWGPTTDRTLRHTDQIEFVVARGRDGNKGSACFDDLSFRELPPAASVVAGDAQLLASSSLPSNPPSQALDGNRDTAWRSDPAAGSHQWLAIDLGQPREFGGLVLRWLPKRNASRYAIEFSDDGEQWKTVREIRNGDGGNDAYRLPESQARFIRIRMDAGPANAYAISEIELKDAAFGDSPNAFIEYIARESTRGHFPRAFAGEQSYWTVLGIDGGKEQGLISEDGAMEFGRRSASIEPFLLTDEGIVTWADAAISQSLLDDYLPVPSVTWKTGNLSLTVTGFASGTRARSQVAMEYAVANASDHARRITLALALRPFQVNPPSQFLNVPGGFSPVHSLSWKDKALFVNGEPRVYPLQEPDDFVGANFDAGDIVDLLSARTHARGNRVDDETGLASAALLYRLELPAHSSRSIAIVAPLTGKVTLPEKNFKRWIDRERARVAGEWRHALNKVSLRLPPAGKPVKDTLRSALAQILVNRDGPALQPGSRSYARAWIRDGAMMSEALLRLGHAQTAREFADWFAPHQFTNGKVPCCVDARGADPVAENDSQGELIHLLAAYHRYTADRTWLRKMWPRMESAVAYMDKLKATERTASNRSPERIAFFGLMPPSISHEGYSDKPAYSYWDDFWSLAGYAGAADAAHALGHADASRFDRRRDAFRKDLQDSIRASMQQHGIDYLPASADRGDFDPTATTIALSVAGEQSRLPQDALRRTFERYWNEFNSRRTGQAAWNDFTPYELRSIGAFIRLGWRERAGELVDYFLGYRRPAAWNQWAEVVGNDARQPRFIGDMPHAWIASDFIQATLDRFAYERQSDRTMVLAAGVPVDWLAAQGVAIENLRTPYGSLSYALQSTGARMRLHVSASHWRAPPGGLTFKWPYSEKPGTATINGRRARWNADGELRVRSLPAAIDMKIPRASNH
ncbi:MAG TPA: discoidin domain-containing protein [Burkholderiales bacterium]|nr:discoidin domain-containing protein [Burkholderiales bacterium]